MIPKNYLGLSLLGKLRCSLAVITLLISGCSFTPVSQTVGRATIEVMSVQNVREKCLNDLALACAQTFELPDKTYGVRLVFPFPPDWGPNERDVYVATHELCHVVNRLQRLPDNCHDRDQGFLPGEFR